MIPPPSLSNQNIRPRVTSTFDLPTPKLMVIPLPRGPFIPSGIEIGSFLFTGLVTNERTNGRTDGRTVWPRGGHK